MNIFTFNSFKYVLRASTCGLLLFLGACADLKTAVDMNCIGQDGVLIIDDAIAKKCCVANPDPSAQCPRSPGIDVIASYDSPTSGNLAVYSAIHDNADKLRAILSGRQVIGTTNTNQNNMGGVAGGGLGLAAGYGASGGSTSSTGSSSSAGGSGSGASSGGDTSGGGDLSASKTLLGDGEDVTGGSSTASGSAVMRAGSAGGAGGDASGGLLGGISFGRGDGGGDGAGGLSTVGSQSYGRNGMFGAGSVTMGNAQGFKFIDKNANLFQAVSNQYGREQVRWQAPIKR